jgi:prevent-host-death family protein
VCGLQAEIRRSVAGAPDRHLCHAFTRVVDGHCRAGSSVDPGYRCSYADPMNVATIRSEVGIREFKNGLSGYIDRVRDGEEVIVTDRGRPVARLSAIDASQDRLAELVAAGIVRPPSSFDRYLPKRRIKAKGSVSELVAEQRC